jgi:hypothetical protein
VQWYTGWGLVALLLAYWGAWQAALGLVALTTVWAIAERREDHERGSTEGLAGGAGPEDERGRAQGPHAERPG